MIGINTTPEDYEINDKLLTANAIKRGLPFVPEGTGKKRYTVVCSSGDDWKYIHEILMQDGTLEDNIPSESKECTNDYKACATIGTYILTDAEVEELKKHPKVLNVHIDQGYYGGTFKGRNVELRNDLQDRYDSDVKINRDIYSSDFTPSNPDSSYLKRTSASIYRHQQKDDPWNGIPTATLLNDNPQNRGDGTDVDIIVYDTDAWHGHIEFVKTGVGEPVNYVGENVLKSGFAPSATTGLCSILDIVLDSPYYLDPDFFEADPSNRLIPRWDGTMVPAEQFARNWWNNNNTSSRSSKYVSPSNGGTASGVNDFGTAYVEQDYTRARQNGSNTALNSNMQTHGTGSTTQAYGKTMGWAYNANKWHGSIHFSDGALDDMPMWTITKVFHTCKPNRTSDNSKNPTMTSHSWGYLRYPASSGYAFYRTPGDGTGGIQYSSKPNWLAGMSYRISAEVSMSQAWQQMAKEATDAGVFIVGAAGNYSQQQVNSDHPNFNNYEATSGNPNWTLEDALSGDYIGRTSVVNRRGAPQDSGRYVQDGVTYYPCINVGALDSNKGSTLNEQIATYSNTGNSIDCWAIGNNSFAGGGWVTRFNRYDRFYTINGVQSYESHDKRFGGTSSACPITCGLIATKLQHNRNWTWQNVKNWLQNNVTNQDSGKMYQGVEPTTINDTKWLDDLNIKGAEPKIIWDAVATAPGPPPPPPPGEETDSDVLLSILPGSGLVMVGGKDTLSILNN